MRPPLNGVRSYLRWRRRHRICNPLPPEINPRTHHRLPNRLLAIGLLPLVFLRLRIGELVRPVPTLFALLHHVDHAADDLLAVGVLHLDQVLADHPGIAAAGQHGALEVVDEDEQVLVLECIAFRIIERLVGLDGAVKAYKTFNDAEGNAFKDKDLFVFVYDFQGTVLASSGNARMVGKNLIEMKDADGQQIVRGVIDMVKKGKKGWYGPYKFSNPQTQEYERKKSYCEQAVGETMVCSGVYLGR